MGSYRREYEEYYRDIKGGEKRISYDYGNERVVEDKRESYIRSRGIYNNDISRRESGRSNRYGRRHIERPIMNLIFTEIIAGMVLFLVLSSFSVLKGVGKGEIYSTTKKLIEKNYTVEEVKDLFGIRSYLENLKGGEE